MFNQHFPETIRSADWGRLSTERLAAVCTVETDDETLIQLASPLLLCQSRVVQSIRINFDIVIIPLLNRYLEKNVATSALF